MGKMIMDAMRLLMAACFFLPLMLVAGVAQTPNTVVSAGGFYDLLQPYLLTIVGAVVTWVVAYIADKIHRRFGVELPAQMQATLQLALTSAAGLFIQKGALAASNIRVDVKSPLMAEAIRYVQNSAPDGVKKWGLTEKAIAEKILAKLPQVAATPVVVTSPQVFGNPPVLGG